MSLRLRQLRRLADLPAADWDALFPPGYPFTRHAFLTALEEQGCARPETGWQPCHAVLEDAAGRPCAAAPLYCKAHSWGEFVFDFRWAEAAQRAGLGYYPKLLTAIPFTPATGPRLGGTAAMQAELLRRLLALPEAMDASSWHGLFLDEATAATAELNGAVLRHDLQFHWQCALPKGSGFADFTARLSQKKRKNIQQERRKVAAAGLRFEARPGSEHGEADWAELYALYANTYEERGQPPYLTPGFFLNWAAAPGSPTWIISAFDGARRVAMAFLVAGTDSLYGRHWGAAARYDGLHFETCYYQGIELALQLGLSRYDAGAQGHHKLARGFDPVQTRSAHLIAHPGLASAVARACAQERQAVAALRLELQAHSAYKEALLPPEHASSDPP